MNRFSVVDLAELAHPPTNLVPAGSADGVDFDEAVRALRHALGRTGRILLAEDDDPHAIEERIRRAAVDNETVIQTYLAGSVLYFYVNGPRPEEFLRQFASGSA